MAHEDADVVKIRSFVTKCLESVGALVEFPEYDYAEVLIPDEFVEHFDGEGYFGLSFDFDVARRHEDSEFVTYGSYFLDKVIDLASQRGLTCSRHIVDENVGGRTLPQKIKGKIAFRNCRATFLANVPVIYHYVLFNFKVSYISDEREDRIIKVLVNLNTGHVDDNMLEAIGSAIFTDSSHTRYTVEQMCSIEDAYQTATRALEERIQAAIHGFSGKVGVRLANEKKRIMEYYDQIDDELKFKRERLVETGKKDGLKSIDDKLRLSEIERQRRLNEVEEKNALRVSVMLFSATLISQTKIRNRYKVKRGRIERDAYVVWNPVLNDIDPQVCEICRDETLELELCSNSHLGCTKCVRTCSVCGTRLCKDCGMTECSVCGVPICGQCKIVCDNCGDVLCERHVELCTCKEEERRKKREAEERKRQKKIRGFQDIPLQLSKSMKLYHDEYVEKNMGKLDESWKESMVEAQAIIAQGDNVKTRAVLKKLDQEYPANAWVRINLVLSYQRWTQRIMSLARQAAHLVPHTALAHTALGHAHQIHGQLWAKMAIDEYERAIELSGDDEADLEANAHFQIGEIQYNRGYLPEASYRWRLALEVDPDFEPARQALSELITRRRQSTRTTRRRRRK
jgi:tetratricopeptide (TPR) repeat protein